ncbi:DUF2254 family protein [Plantactinospora sp. GCM10030261]|uniref:DUF2254 family protein n=1 Tax=Plantactinospora sp. GCM10030261 TaxID=3273420 RepID=UPI0036136E81
MRRGEPRRERTLGQDVGFGFRQLTDIAERALSPGINDTTTAVTCSPTANRGTAGTPAPHRAKDRGPVGIRRP